ncbi:MAG: hypothetical protein GF346_09545, partial [Candidatus Eisenbacteria bacterium]|nr:hypothetical protein [Candidatus Latescibacterota bacterium]MBD3302676.1 hypothetical protein [Candidatus Eisenbacteria bacterium]
MRRQILLSVGLATLPILLHPGCAPYRYGMEPVLVRMEQGDVPGALERLRGDPREGDALYLLERGLLERLAGRLEESSRSFEEAVEIAEDLYTRSLSREAAALAVTDRVRPYRPPPHEILLARYYQ